MNVIRHENRRNHCPISNELRDLGKRDKRLIVRKHRTSVLHAEGNKINYRLIIAEPERDPRWMSHAATLSNR